MSEPDDKDRRNAAKLDFEITRAVMLLLAILIVAGVLVSLALVVRCVVWPIAACERDWNIRGWFQEIIILLLALLARRE